MSDRNISARPEGANGGWTGPGVVTTKRPCPDCFGMGDSQGVEGRWMIQVDREGEQRRDPVMGGRAIPVVPCDAEAVQRVADELRSMLGDVPLDFRELAEMALRAAGEASDPSSPPFDPASERLGPEVPNPCPKCGGPIEHAKDGPYRRCRDCGHITDSLAGYS